MADFGTFIGSSYRSQSPVSDQEELINFYVEQMESPGATSPASLYPTPGVQLFTFGNAIGCRAMFTSITTTDPFPSQIGRCFAVNGDKFDEILSNSACVTRGIVAVDEFPATICSNGYGPTNQGSKLGQGELFITSGGKGYIYDLGANTFTEVADLAGFHCTQGGCLNGIFLAFSAKTSEIRLSDTFDGLAWQGDLIIARTLGADPWRAMAITPYGQIVLPGEKTGEIWYNDGSFPIPFVPDLSGNFAYGCEATFSISVVGDLMCWLGKTPDGGIQVIGLKGYRADRISTHAMEFEGASYPRLNDAIGQSYVEQGHLFYLLTFPTAEVTWGFDARGPEGRQWHKRVTWISEQDRYVSWGPTFHTFAFGMHLMGDRRTNIIYQMANRLPVDTDGRVIRRVRRSPTLQDENQLVIYNWFELLMETGIGQDAPMASPAGPPPVVMLRISNDSGRTWGNERQARAGAQGAYKTRVYWDRLGQGRQRVFEVVVTDAVRNWRITAAFLRAPEQARQRTG
jgi:hypothetical protein